MCILLTSCICKRFPRFSMSSTASNRSIKSANPSKIIENILISSGVQILSIQSGFDANLEKKQETLCLKTPFYFSFSSCRIHSIFSKKRYLNEEDEKAETVNSYPWCFQNIAKYIFHVWCVYANVCW